MFGSSRKNSVAWPHRRTVLRGGTIGVAVGAASILGWSLLAFPFEPALSTVRMTFALAAAGLFFAGALVLMLAGRLESRFAGAQAMAAAAAVLLIAAAGDGIAWLAAVLGWGATAGMSAWGATLARRIGARGGGEESGR